MLRKMVVPGETIEEEESEESKDAASTASESSTGSLEPDFTVVKPSASGVKVEFSMLPLHTRSYGTAKKEKDREPFYKGEGVVYLPGDINGLAKKLQLLAAELFAGNTTARNELVHVLDVLLR